MSDALKVALWRQRYFEAQAAAEEFVLGRHGEPGLSTWIEHNSTIAAALIAASQESDADMTEVFFSRLYQQLELYDSEVHIERDGAMALKNTRCGILTYRKQAAARGVKLTFESPCGYCMELNSSIARKLIGHPDPVVCQTDGEGCEWRAAVDE
jgi:hypothetical protein